jgi:hypothetical protein
VSFEQCLSSNRGIKSFNRTEAVAVSSGLSDGRPPTRKLPYARLPCSLPLLRLVMVPTSRCASFCRRDRGVAGGDRADAACNRGRPGGFTRPAAPAHHRAPVVGAAVRRGARQTPTSPETVTQRWPEWRKKDRRRGKVQIHCNELPNPKNNASKLCADSYSILIHE